MNVASVLTCGGRLSAVVACGREGRARPGILGLLLLLCIGCREQSSEPSPPPPSSPVTSAASRTAVEQYADLPDVILVVIDTLRADHVGCYGYARPVSPRIDGFAAGATRFTTVIAPAPWTVPSHASLFTGLFPFEHGAHTFKVEKPSNNVHPLATRFVTLAEVFKKMGYATGAFVANAAYLSPRWQMDQGFDTYHVEHSYARTLNRRIWPWLDEHSDKPFFLFINYMDTHRPYNTAPREGLLDQDVVRDNGELVDELYNAVIPAKGPVPPDLVQRVIDQYDTGIANVDEHLGGVLDRLRALGVYDNAIVVITSDHGEYFGEHHLAEHSKDIYEPALRVPLMVKMPGQSAGRVVEMPTSLVIVPNLILSALPEAVAGPYRSTFPRSIGQTPLIAENYYTRLKDLFQRRWGYRFNRVRHALYEWPMKYIRSSDDRNELYDVVKDPSESENLIESRPDVAAAMAARLDALLAHAPAAEDVELPTLTEEEQETLKSLGYLGD